MKKLYLPWETVGKLEQLSGFPKSLQCSIKIVGISDDDDDALNSSSDQGVGGPISSFANDDLSTSLASCQVVDDISFWDRLLATSEALRKEIFQAPIKKMTKITHDKAVKQAYLFSLDITHLDSWDYVPGDSFSIYPKYADELVVSLIERLGFLSKRDNLLTLKDFVVSSAPMLTLTPLLRAFRHGEISLTVFEAFKYCFDLDVFPKKAFLRSLADYTEDLQERKMLLFLASRQGSTDYISLKEQHPSLLDFLLTFKTCKPSLVFLLEHLSPLFPRDYSIATSPLSSRQEIQFCFNETHFYSAVDDGGNLVYSGLCTSMLVDMFTSKHPEGQMQLALSKKPPTFFHLPLDVCKPIILIAAGTGLAPFISFLRHLEALQLQGMSLPPIWLFFGCRNSEFDYIFQDDIERWTTMGLLCNVTVAFSRDNQVDKDLIISPIDGNTLGKNYIQLHVKKHAEEIYDWFIKREGYIYVCGSGSRMFKGVNDALISCIATHGHMETLDASKVLFNLSEGNQKRYLKEVWA